MASSITPNNRQNYPVNTDKTSGTDKVTDSQQATNDLAKTLADGLSGVGNMPVSISTLSTLYSLYTSRNIQETVDSLIETDPSIHEQPGQGSASFKNIRDDLNKLKDKLGGSPNFHGKEPKLELHKKFLGIPIDTVRDFFSKAVYHGWHPSFLWEALSKAFGTGSEGRTRYEFAALSLQRYEIVKDNIEKIRADFQNPFLSDQDIKESFAKLTGFLIHVQLNGRDASLKTIETQLEMLDSLYKKAKDNNTLEEFFMMAFEARACFEDRMDAFQAYAMTHLDEGVQVDLNKMKDYTEDSSKDRALGEELKVFLQNNPDATASGFKAHLMETVGITSKKARADPRSEPEKITEAEVNAFIQQQVDYYTIEGDDNFVAS